MTAAGSQKEMRGVDEDAGNWWWAQAPWVSLRQWIWRRAGSMSWSPKSAARAIRRALSAITFRRARWRYSVGSAWPQSCATPVCRRTSPTTAPIGPRQRASSCVASKFPAARPVTLALEHFEMVAVTDLLARVDVNPDGDPSAS